MKFNVSKFNVVKFNVKFNVVKFNVVELGETFPNFPESFDESVSGISFSETNSDRNAESKGPPRRVAGPRRSAIRSGTFPTSSTQRVWSTHLQHGADLLG
eukprot:701817-Pyramimonas_sp.AAC.1